MGRNGFCGQVLTWGSFFLNRLGVHLARWEWVLAASGSGRVGATRKAGWDGFEGVERISVIIIGAPLSSQLSDHGVKLARSCAMSARFGSSSCVRFGGGGGVASVRFGVASDSS